MSRKTIFRTLPFCFALALGTAGVSAEPTAADKETARALLLDGRAKMAAKDYEGALKSLKAAHAIMNVPTTGLDLARALSGLNQLIEARELALQVARMPAKQGESTAFADARKEAETFAAELGPRIPSIIVNVTGGSAAEVKVNGALIALDTLGLPRKVNPGHHIVIVRSNGNQTVTRELDVKESQTATVEVLLPTAGIPTTTANPNGSATEIAPTATTAPTAAPSSKTPVWTWIGGGVGLVALGVGTVFFVDYMNVQGTVARDCPDNICDPLKQDANSAQALRAQWNRDIALTLGMAGVAAAGITVAIVGLASKSAGAPAPNNGNVQPPLSKSKPIIDPQAKVSVGFGSLFVHGTF